MKAIWNNKVLAESENVVEIEGCYYFPIASLRSKYFLESRTKSTCPWKGRASYLSLAVDGEFNEDAAWYYTGADDCADILRNRVSFWKGVEFKETESYRRPWQIIKGSLGALF